MANRLQQLIDKVERLYNPPNPEGDDWSDWAYENHVLVVVKHAENLAERYNADIEQVVAAAYRRYRYATWRANP